MTDKEFRRLDKRDLYELLLEKSRQNDALSQEVEQLRLKVKELEEVVRSRRVTIDISGEEAEILLGKVIGEKNEAENSSEPEEKKE